MERWMTGAAVVVVGMLCAAPAWAGSVFNVNFDGMTSGAAPQTAAASKDLVNTKPTSVKNSVLVQDSFTAGTATLANKPVVMTFYDNVAGLNNVELDLAGHANDYATSESYEISYDLIISDQGMTYGKVALRTEFYTNDGSSLAGVGFDARDSSSNRIWIFIPGNPSVSVADSGWVLNDLMRVTIKLDKNDNKVRVSLDGQEVASASLSVSLAGAGVRRVLLYSGSNGSATSPAGFTAAIDNIAAGPVVIPEPASAMALAVGIAGLASRGRNR